MDLCHTNGEMEIDYGCKDELCIQESSPLKGGRGSASLVAKCKMCSRENSIDIIQDSITPYDASESFKTIVVFDCRGIEPVDFSPRVR